MPHASPAPAHRWLLFAVAWGCSEYELAKKTGAEAGEPDTGQPAESTPEDTAEPPLTTPDIVLSPTAVDAGTVLVGEAVVSTVTVRNAGDADLHIDHTWSGWTVVPDISGTTLVPGDTARLTVRTTAVPGAQTDRLEVHSDDPDEPIAVVPLAYEGLDPCSWAGWVADDTCAGGWGGTGADGAGVLANDFAPTRTTLTSAAAGTELLVADSAGFQVDDEVALWSAADGGFGLGRVTAVAAGVLTLADPLAGPQGAPVQRVPHYTSLTVTADTQADLIVARVCGAAQIDADLHAGSGGHAGGQRTTGIPELGWQGQSQLGPGGQSDQPNGTGGGGGSESCNVHTDGGGGGHATAGGDGGDLRSYPCGGTGGLGGETIGDAALTSLFAGGGGGSGQLDNDAGGASYGGAGGAGGGVIYLVATDGFTGAGQIHANGADGEDGYFATGGASPGGGGGGAGGSVWLVGDVGVSVSASGGGGGDGSEAGGSVTQGGAGGEGRVRVDGVADGSVTPAPYLPCESADTGE